MINNIDNKLLIVKFRSGTLYTQRLAHLEEAIGNKALAEVHPLFPGEQDETLSSIYVVTLSATISIDKAVQALNSDTVVEYAHQPNGRMAY